jgi:hypothetical protein
MRSRAPAPHTHAWPPVGRAAQRVPVGWLSIGHVITVSREIDIRNFYNLLQNGGQFSGKSIQYWIMMLHSMATKAAFLDIL